MTKREARQLPEPGTQGIADARLLPDAEFQTAWDRIVLPDQAKERLLRNAVASVRLRDRLEFEEMPLHGVQLLTGPPGTGKTTIARGLADRVSRTITGDLQWAFLEVDPHGLASSSLGRSQRSVDALFGDVLTVQAELGPTVILLDEVETLVTDRGALSMEANPIDVHRAVDAALVGLDRLARRFPGVVVLATSNFSKAVDPALESRADNVVEVPLPDQAAREAILRDAVQAFTGAFPAAQGLLDDDVLTQAASVSEGLDGRRLRKSLAMAVAHRPEAAGDPANVTGDDLVAALSELTGL